jgi:hypothetical protein
MREDSYKQYHHQGFAFNLVKKGNFKIRLETYPKKLDPRSGSSLLFHKLQLNIEKFDALKLQSHQILNFLFGSIH